MADDTNAGTYASRALDQHHHLGGIPGHRYVPWLAALSAALVLVATVRGPGLTPDSIAYLSTGVNLAEGHGLTILTGEQLTVSPPGLPLVAALGELTGVGGQQAVRFLGAACAAAIVVLGHHLLRRTRVHGGLLPAMTVLLAVSPMLLQVTSVAWTEAPFIVATLAFLLMLTDARPGVRLSARRLAGLAALCWLAFAFRYAGGCLIVAGTIALAIRVRHQWPRIVAFTILASIPPAAWMLRNLAVDGTLMGPRVPSPDTPTDVATRLAQTVGQWVIGADADAVLLGSLGALAVGIVLLRLVTHRQSITAATPVAVFVAVYLVYVSGAQLVTGIDPIGPRLLSPIYVPVSVLTAAALQPGFAVPRSRLGREGAVAVVLLIAQTAFTAQFLRTAIADGSGYNQQVSVESELASATHATAVDGIVYTNNIDIMWAATGMQPLRRAPRSAGIRGVPLQHELAAFTREAACTDKPLHLAMFNVGDSYAFMIEEIAEVVQLELVATTSDGALYEATSAAACD